ncbi:hypothetical protein MMC30_007322 [Trapelia coarctata]|nr:hypothetical protein [Trapelia coarctata]
MDTIHNWRQSRSKDFPDDPNQEADQETLTSSDQDNPLPESSISATIAGTANPGARRLVNFSPLTHQSPNIQWIPHEGLQELPQEWRAERLDGLWHLNSSMPPSIPTPVINRFPLQPSGNITSFNPTVVANLLFQFFILVYWGKGSGDILLLSPERCANITKLNMETQRPVTAAVIEMACLLPYFDSIYEESEIAPGTRATSPPVGEKPSEVPADWHFLRRDVTFDGHILPPHMMFLTEGNIDGYINGPSLILDTETGMVMEVRYDDWYEPTEGTETILTTIEGPQTPVEEILRSWINKYLTLEWIGSPAVGVESDNSHVYYRYKKTYKLFGWPLFPPGEATLNGEQISFWQELEAGKKAIEAWIEEASKPAESLAHLLQAVHSHNSDCAGSPMWGSIYGLYNHLTEDRDKDMKVLWDLIENIHPEHGCRQRNFEKYQKEMEMEDILVRNRLIENGEALQGHWRIDTDNLIKDFEEDPKHRWVWREEGKPGGKRMYFQKLNVPGAEGDFGYGRLIDEDNDPSPVTLAPSEEFPN